MPYTLAIEISQREGGVAIRPADLGADGAHTAGDILTEPILSGPGGDGLAPAVERLCLRAGQSPADCALIGVSIGPGGFTGLRTAVTFAQILARVTGAPVAAIPSAHVAAASIDSATVPAGTLLVVLGVKREQFWATRFERGADGHWQQASAAGLADASAVALEGLAAIAVDAHAPALLRERARAPGVPCVAFRHDPADCLRLAERARAAGATIAPEALRPIYGREPEAVTLWNARHGNGGAHDREA